MKKIFFLLFIMLSVVSCSDDDDNDYSQRVTNFSVPELTEANTIQFSVTVNNQTKQSFYIGGKRIAIDWGDGSAIEKDDLSRNRSDGDYDNREVFNHTYSKNGTYTVKIWSQETTVFRMFSDLINKSYTYGNFSFGACPLMEELTLESIDSENVKFPSLPIQALTIQSLENVTSIDVNALSNLSKLYITNAPKLTALDVSRNSKLWELSCSNMPVLESINLGKNTEMARLSFEDCDKLAAVDLSGVTNLGVLDISKTGIKTLDITKQTTLGEFTCTHMELETIDLSKNRSLYNLTIAANLTSLDISANEYLKVLNCQGNQLTALDVTKNKNIEAINISHNKFGKDALNKVFADLPKSKYMKSTPPQPQCYIAFYENPGTEDCDTDILTEKGWNIVPNNK